MSSYYRFLLKIVLKNKSIWVNAAIIWIFYLTILIIIPLAANISPLFLWTNQMANLNGISVILIASYAVCCVYFIFKNSQEDGTDLLIVSKRINRTTIILTKFLTYLTCCLFISISSVIMCLLVLSFGWYDPINNTNGIKINEFWQLEVSIFLGLFIVCILFGSIGIIFSIFLKKIGMMTITTGLALLLQLISTGITILRKTPEDISNSKYGYDIVNANYFRSKEDEISTMLYMDDGIYDRTEIYVDNTKNINDLSMKGSKLQMYNYIDIGTQLASLFRLFDLGSINDAYYSSYGLNSNVNYVLTEQDQIFADVNDPQIIDNNFKPMFYVGFKDNIFVYYLLGLDTQYYSIYQSIGCNSNTRFVIEDQNLIASKFYDYNVIKLSSPIIEHQNESGQYVGGCKEYGQLRSRLFQKILKNESLDIDSFALDILNFLCNAIHYYESNEEIASSGFEGIYHLKYENLTNKEFSLCYMKIIYNLIEDCYSLFYNDIDRLTMFRSEWNDNESTDNLFIYHLKQDFGQKNWTWYNNKTLTTDEFFDTYRFLFGPESDQPMRNYNQESSGTLYRFFSNVINPLIEKIKNHEGFVKPKQWTGSLPTADSTFSLNILTNKLYGFNAIRTSSNFIIKKILSSDQVMIFWLFISVIIMCFVFIFYFRIDFK